MEEIKYAPNLRFPNFCAAWERQQLAEVASIRRGLTYKPCDIVEKGVRVLRSSNIDEDTFVFSKEDIFVRDTAVNIPYINNGDIIITAANGSTRLVGKHAIVRHLPQCSAVAGGFMLAVSSEDPGFLNASMNSRWYKAFLATHVAGGNGAIGNLKKGDLEKCTLMMPTDKAERQMLGHFFTKIDQFIELQQQKLQQYQALKNGMLEKMFPKDGETVPEIRFPGFEGEWERKKLKELEADNLIELKRGNIIPKSTTGNYPVYSSSIQNDGLMGYSNDFMFDSELVTWSIDGGGNFFYRKPHKYSVTNVCGYIVINKPDELHCQFLAYCLQHLHCLQHFDYIVKAHPSVIRDLYTLPLPCIEEQKKIADFFAYLDNLILLNQYKLEQYKKLKEGLLQQMFV